MFFAAAAGKLGPLLEKLKSTRLGRMLGPRHLLDFFTDGAGRIKERVQAASSRGTRPSSAPPPPAGKGPAGSPPSRGSASATNRTSGAEGSTDELRGHERFKGQQALGEDGPEIDAMRETGKRGAGMAEPPLHHVFPREHRKWFEDRGFKGSRDIDNYCVKMAEMEHQRVHGGGDPWLGRRAWEREYKGRPR